MTPEKLIRDHLSANPIIISPWKIAQFFEDESNISEEFLDKSLETLSEILPEFEKTNRKMVEELEKVALLAVPMFRKLPLMTILTIIREATSSTQVFSLLPDFPKPPAANLLNHIYPDDSMSEEEKKASFEQIAKSIPQVLKHLVSWRNHVGQYVEGLETFLSTHEVEMSEEQQEHVEALLERTRKLIPLIDKKIEEKNVRKADESAQFARFYRVVSKEPSYATMDPQTARARIQRVFDDSDETVRQIIVRMAGEDVVDEELKVAKKRAADTTSRNGTAKKATNRVILVETRNEKPINLASLTADS